MLAQRTFPSRKNYRSRRLSKDKKRRHLPLNHTRSDHAARYRRVGVHTTPTVRVLTLAVVRADGRAPGQPRCSGYPRHSRPQACQEERISNHEALSHCPTSRFIRLFRWPAPCSQSPANNKEHDTRVASAHHTRDLARACAGSAWQEDAHHNAIPSVSHTPIPTSSASANADTLLESNTPSCMFGKSLSSPHARHQSPKHAHLSQHIQLISKAVRHLPNVHLSELLCICSCLRPHCLHSTANAHEHSA